MKLDRLRELVESVMNDDGKTREWREGGLIVTVGLQGSAQVAGALHTTCSTAEDSLIVSTMPGQLHFYSEPGAPPFVQLGQSVEAGQRVALLEAMKTFCPVVTARAGRIVEILVEHGSEVAVGQPLFRVV